MVSNIGVFILQILDKLEEENKSSIIGFIFKKIILNEISKEIGLRLIYIIEKIIFSDLIDLYTQKEDEIYKNRILTDSIATTGILTPLDSGGVLSSGDENYPISYELNNIGKELIKILKY